MIEIRKQNSLRGILSYIFRCSTRSWELYFLESKLDLAIGEARIPLKPIYQSIRFRPKAETANNLKPTPVVPDGSDIVLPPDLDGKVRTLDNKFKEYFHTSDEDYLKFMSQIALGVMLLYMPDEKSFEKLEGSTSGGTIKKLDHVSKTIRKSINEIQSFFLHEPLEGLHEKYKTNYAAIQYMMALKKLWEDNNIEGSFELMKEDIKKMFDSGSKEVISRNFGTMYIYHQIKKNFHYRDFISLPENVDDFPYKDGEHTNFQGGVSEDVFCQFLTYQIVSLFQEKQRVSFSNIQTLKKTKKYPSEILLEMNDKSVDDLFDYFESRDGLTDSYSFERARLPSLEPYLENLLSSLRNNQPLSYEKLDILTEDARRDTSLIEAINKGRKKLPR